MDANVVYCCGKALAIPTLFAKQACKEMDCPPKPNWNDVCSSCKKNDGRKVYAFTALNDLKNIDSGLPAYAIKIAGEKVLEPLETLTGREQVTKKIVKKSASPPMVKAVAKPLPKAPAPAPVPVKAPALTPTTAPAVASAPAPATASTVAGANPQLDALSQCVKTLEAEITALNATLREKERLLVATSTTLAYLSGCSTENSTYG